MTQQLSNGACQLRASEPCESRVPGVNRALPTQDADGFEGDLDLAAIRPAINYSVIIPHSVAIGPGRRRAHRRTGGGKVERPPGAPARAAGREGLSQAAGRAPSDRVPGPSAAVFIGSRRGCLGKWKTCVGGVSLAKRVAKQCAARSVPRAAATAPAPWSLQGKGEGEEVTEFTSPPPPLPE